MNTIIFDMGMVLVDFRWRAFLKELGYDAVQTEQIGQAVFLNPLWQEFDRGIRTDEDILAEIRTQTPEVSEALDNIWENFRDVCHPFDYAETLVRKLHEAGYRIYILSNYGKRLFSLDREMFTFLNHVDGGIISAKVNQIKPHEDIFETLLTKYEIRPEDAVFFDDNRENCETARRLGIAAVEVDGLVSILEGLEKYAGVKIAEKWQ